MENDWMQDKILWPFDTERYYKHKFQQEVKTSNIKKRFIKKGFSDIVKLLKSFLKQLYE